MSCLSVGRCFLCRLGRRLDVFLYRRFDIFDDGFDLSFEFGPIQWSVKVLLTTERLLESIKCLQLIFTVFVVIFYLRHDLGWSHFLRLLLMVVFRNFRQGSWLRYHFLLL